MAEIVMIEGQEYKKRGPWASWGLSFITIGIYGLVWYYKINDEARRYLRDDSIRPAVSVLAIIPGALLLIPPFVSIYRTGQRIQRMQERAGREERVEPILGMVLGFFYSLYIPYYQSHLNRVWDRAGTAGYQQLPAPPDVPPPPPPA